MPIPFSSAAPALFLCLMVPFLAPAQEKGIPVIPPGVEKQADIVYAEPHGTPLKLDLYVPTGAVESPRPLAIWIHGGGWRMGSKETWVNPLFLATRGYVVASLQYRLSQAATFPAQIEDCKAAVRFLRQNAAAYNLDPKRFAGVGESAGGYLVSMLGVTAGKKVWDGPETSSVDDEVQAVIDLFGPSDLTDITQGGGEEKPNTAPFFVHHMMGCTPTERPDLYRLASPVTHISAKTPPFLILHGEGDPLVPVAQSHILYDALQKGGVPSELIIVPVKYHAGPGFWTKEMQERMIAFLQRSLQLPAQP